MARRADQAGDGQEKAADPGKVDRFRIGWISP
jgi:hypothetical protein